MRATSDDPLAAGLLEALNDLLERHERVGRVLSAAMRSLATLPGPEPASAGDQPGADDSIAMPPPPGPPPGAPGVARAFQRRLEEVYGVARVTFEGSGPDGFRFLVEMEASPATSRTEMRRDG
ncbi:MAG: hypothetical protein IH609_03635 [Dehalococcoidia bacterium]|nr:hypothetical protein [Dehalococcoidia bacterium]